MNFDEAGTAIVPFGKYYTWPLARLLKEQPGYFRWLLNRKEIKSRRLAEALAVYRDNDEVIRILDQWDKSDKARQTKAASHRRAASRWGKYYDR